MGQPELGIRGAPISTCLCYLTILCINLWYIRRQRVSFSLVRSFGKPLFCAAMMGLFVRLIFGPLENLLGSGRMMEVLAVFLTVGVAAIFYLLLLGATRALTREDILMLPKGEKLAKMLKL